MRIDQLPGLGSLLATSVQAKAKRTCVIDELHHADPGCNRSERLTAQLYDRRRNFTRRPQAQLDRFSADAANQVVARADSSFNDGILRNAGCSAKTRVLTRGWDEALPRAAEKRCGNLADSEACASEYCLP